MRVVVVAVLLFLNVAFALWMYYGTAPGAGPPSLAATDPAIEPLVLWSERDAREISSRRPPGDGEPTSDRPAATSSTTSPGLEDEPPTAPPVAATTLAETGPGPEAVPAPAPAAPVPKADGESPQASGEAADGAGAGSAQTPPPGPSQCHALGPFGTRRAALAAVDQLTARQVDAQVREISAVEPRYWVYLPPFVSRSAAFAGEQALRAKGIEDIQVLAGNGVENGISLGLYRDKGSAERRIRQIRALGYAPKMDVLQRSQVSYWVEAPAHAAREPSWAQAIREPGIRLELRACAGQGRP